MDHALGFVMFFVAFLVLLITVISYLPVPENILTGLTPAEINAVTDPILPPDENATAWDNIIFNIPGSGIGMFLNKMYILTKASSEYQFLSILLSVFVVGIILVIYSMIRGN